MKVSSNQNSPNFKAHLLAQWRCTSATRGAHKSVSIAQLERADLGFVEDFIKKINTVKINDSTTRDIFESTLRTAKEVLSSNNSSFDKSKVLFAIYNNKPCGILIANLPKVSTDGEGIEYSSRHNSAKNETEMDWFVTWAIDGAEKIRGVGKALVGEYFRTLRGDKFRDVFLRSELPENSYAQAFYESIGFEQLGDKRQQFERRTTKPLLVENYCSGSDMIVPMVIVRKKSAEAAKELADRMCRHEFVRNSVPAEELMSI